MFSGHTTWIFYSMLVRIFKHINTPFMNSVSTTSSFSSYPGQIASADDFYVNSNLIVMETSNSIFNTTLYNQVIPQNLLSWQRTTLANRLSMGGKAWSEIF